MSPCVMKRRARIPCLIERKRAVSRPRRSCQTRSAITLLSGTHIYSDDSQRSPTRRISPQDMTITPLRTSLIRRALAATALLAIVASQAAYAEDSAMPAQSARNLAQEENNRALVVHFYDTVFNQHDLSIASTVL